MRALLLLVLILPVLVLADTSSTTVSVYSAQCSDAVDNDGDAIVDYPLDPGCTGYGDNDEIDSSFLCSDSVDNDADSLIDFPADPGCDSPTDQTENNIPASSPDPASYGGTISGLIQFFRPILVPGILPPTPSEPEAVPVQTPDGPMPPHTPPTRRPMPILPMASSTPPEEVGMVVVFDGVVLGEEGVPIAQAKVLLFARLSDGTLVPVEIGGGAQVARLTNSQGYYKLDPVPDGSYSIQISAPGYRTQVIAGDVQARQESTLERESAVGMFLSVATEDILGIPLCGESSSCANPSWVPILALMLLIVVQITVVRIFLRV